MYVTKSYTEVMEKRMDRAQALPGFPYISYAGAEALKMAHSFKAVMRDNLAEALYRDGNRKDKSTVDMANKTLRDLSSKDYVERHSLGSSFGYLYTLGRLGSQYLGIPHDPVELKLDDMIDHFAVNRVFTVLCYELREKYTLGWDVDDKGVGATCIVWEDSSQQKQLKRYRIEYIKTRITEDVFEVIQKLRANLAKGESLILAKEEINDFMLEIDGNTTEADIKEWVS